ncbi:hypothetical protein Godav_006082 [Gossypium davidsonii]|uniref:DUF7745 domain-containing protein n=1 Tax=Gossypium davidsonii TaxID=34287 RepID=A0A7J8S2J8_GOSDV|nr:hypothetical protein [Gossypium davidsonii]
MRLSEPGPKQHSEKKVIVWPRDMYQSYGTSPVDKHLFRALAQFWNPTYGCFTFRKVDLVPRVEEYITLLRCSKSQVDKVYSRVVNDPTFFKKLMNITGMNTKKKVDVFALSIYGLVVFPNTLGHVDEAVTDLFDRLDKKVTPVSLLLALFHSHFWKVDKVSYRVFSENYSPLKEIVAILRRDDISEEKWMEILQNLQEEDIEWRAP